MSDPTRKNWGLIFTASLLLLTLACYVRATPSPMGQVTQAVVASPVPTVEPTATPVPEQSPTEGPARVAMLTTPFEGELNGFTFFGSNFESPICKQPLSPKCTVSATCNNNVRDAPEEEGIASRLNFTVTYLPAGAEQRYVAVSACEDDVIVMSREYSVQGGIVQVVRMSGPPCVSSFRPRDLLEATTIGGRPAVILKPIIPNPKGRMIIYMRDDLSLWNVNTFQLGLEELIKVAEGVK